MTTRKRLIVVASLVTATTGCTRNESAPAEAPAPVDGFGEDGIGTGDSGDAPDCTAIADRDPPAPRATALDGVTVATLAGGAQPGLADGTGGEAAFANPVNVAVDPAGDLVVADFGNDRLRLVTSAGKVFTVGNAMETFHRPFGLAWMNGMLIVQTDRNTAGDPAPDSGSLWIVDVAAGEATILDENLGRPRGLAGGDQLFMADVQHHAVQRFDPVGGSVEDWAGSWDCPGFADGFGEEARFDTPAGIALDPDGNLIVADRGNHAIRRITPKGKVTTIAGQGTPGYVDGPHAEAYFDQPVDVAVDAAGRVYVSDLGNRRLRRIGPDGVVTVAGDGEAGFADGAGTEASFHGQEGIDVSADGLTLYVADGTLGGSGPYHRLRAVSLE